MTVANGALVGEGDGKRDEEQRDADPVVETALDVEALSNPHGEAWGGDDRLPERGIGRRDDVLGTDAATGAG